jgi:hypothetical protein
MRAQDKDQFFFSSSGAGAPLLHKKFTMLHKKKTAHIFLIIFFLFVGMMQVNSSYSSYRPGDPVLRAYNLPGSTAYWSDVTRTTSTVNGVTINTFISTMTCNTNPCQNRAANAPNGGSSSNWANGFNVVITNRIADQQILINTTYLNPNNLKSDIEINNWPWAGTAPNSKLALVMFTGSKSAVKPPETLSAGDASSTTGTKSSQINNGQGWFSWNLKVCVT